MNQPISLRQRINALNANMEAYAEMMSNWQAMADTQAELDALNMADKLFKALLVIIMTPSIKEYLLKTDPKALEQAIEAVKGIEQ